jgi:hypothetical protein
MKGFDILFFREMETSEMLLDVLKSSAQLKQDRKSLRTLKKTHKEEINDLKQKQLAEHEALSRTHKQQEAELRKRHRTLERKPRQSVQDLHKLNQEQRNYRGTGKRMPHDALISIWAFLGLGDLHDIVPLTSKRWLQIFQSLSCNSRLETCYNLPRLGQSFDIGMGMGVSTESPKIQCIQENAIYASLERRELLCYDLKHGARLVDKRKFRFGPGCISVDSKGGVWLMQLYGHGYVMIKHCSNVMKISESKDVFNALLIQNLSDGCKLCSSSVTDHSVWILYQDVRMRRCGIFRFNRSSNRVSYLGQIDLKQFRSDAIPSLLVTETEHTFDVYLSDGECLFRLSQSQQLTNAFSPWILERKHQFESIAKCRYLLWKTHVFVVRYERRSKTLQLLTANGKLLYKTTGYQGNNGASYYYHVQDDELQIYVSVPTEAEDQSSDENDRGDEFRETFYSGAHVMVWSLPLCVLANKM